MNTPYVTVLSRPHRAGFSPRMEYRVVIIGEKEIEWCKLGSHKTAVNAAIAAAAMLQLSLVLHSHTLPIPTPGAQRGIGRLREKLQEAMVTP